MMSENEMLLHMSVFLDRRLIPLKYEIENIKKSISEIKGEDTGVKPGVRADRLSGLQDGENSQIGMTMAKMLEDEMYCIDGIQKELSILQNVVAEQSKMIEKLEPSNTVV